MQRQFLEFEQPIDEIAAKLNELRYVDADSAVDISAEVQRLEKQQSELMRSVFSTLTPWQITQLARHPLRPHSSDYIQRLFVEFDELHGDRHYAAGTPLIGGMAYLGTQPVMVLGHEKGRKVNEKVRRNFAMARPEDYRKALRLMRLAEKFSMPVITFIDTPGAYPGIGAEERNQSEAIATNLMAMSQLTVPIIAVVIGEGGSGGALAIGVADRVLMLQYSVYSVISPEGCASILWKSAEKADLAAQAMGVTAENLFQHGLIDEIVAEPLGGAHRDIEQISKTLQLSLVQHLQDLSAKSVEVLVAERYQRYRQIGVNPEC
jgi:acetyl-CoA carboxylase carboxyl transferase subunit alpha